MLLRQTVESGPMLLRTDRRDGSVRPCQCRVGPGAKGMRESSSLLPSSTLLAAGPEPMMEVTVDPGTFADHINVRNPGFERIASRRAAGPNASGAMSIAGLHRPFANSFSVSFLRTDKTRARLGPTRPAGIRHGADRLAARAAHLRAGSVARLPRRLAADRVRITKPCCTHLSLPGNQEGYCAPRSHQLDWVARTAAREGVGRSWRSATAVWPDPARPFSEPS